MADEVIERMSATVLGLSQELLKELLGEAVMKQDDIMLHQLAIAVAEIVTKKEQSRYNTDLEKLVEIARNLLAEEGKMVDYYANNFTLDEMDAVSGYDPAQDEDIRRGRSILDRLEAELGDGDSTTD